MKGYVSIPRSGFWVFKLLQQLRHDDDVVGFNPSVGILGVQAGQAGGTAAQRASGASFNPSVGILGVQAAAVRGAGDPSRIVSIPRSGFWVFKLGPSCPRPRRRRGFNPSVGILGVQATMPISTPNHSSGFQSLGRDSGCSSNDQLAYTPPAI